MNIRSVFHLVAYLVFFVACAMGLSAAVSYFTGDPAQVTRGMLDAAFLCGAVGGLIWVCTRGAVNLTRRDGFAIVTFGWLTVGVLGALPYWLPQSISGVVDAIFESMSGFTNTGSTILEDIEVLPRGILFWRSLTQWMGGMGVLLLCVAILPFLGVGGMQIYRAEMPGPSKDRLTPRIANTAKLLYGVYVLLTALQVIALRLAGLSLFDSVCHALTTMPTGGFSTYNASIAEFESVTVHLIILVFMFLAGTNFALHFRALRGNPGAYFRAAEWKMYAGLVAAATAIIAVDLFLHRGMRGEGIVDAGFQVVSIVTTTGYATADYETWPLLSKTVLFFLLFTGACAGSTSGGMKVVRHLILFKECRRQLQLFIRPQAVLKVRMDGKSVTQQTVSGIIAFTSVYLALFVLVTLIMTLFVPDLATAASSVLACLSNVGPGFSMVGPTQTFAHLHSAAKLILSVCMILGRLELFTVLVLLTPSFWQR